MVTSVLVIDDDEVIHDLFKILLKRLDLDPVVVSAMNGKEALEELEKSSFDLIILDLNMPVLSGYDFLERVKHRTELSICILSSSLNSDDRQLVDKYTQVIKYIEKPLTKEGLKETMEK